jgi:glycosyltransferase involved in cell wall biosynthesis
MGIARQETRRVLLVSFHFPPDAGVGGLRCQKFAKYLPAYAWTPHVLTVRERYYPRVDPSRFRDVQNTAIWRTRAWPSPRIAALAVRAALLRALGRGNVTMERQEKHSRITLTERNRVRPGRWAALRRTLLSFASLPDDQVGWLAPGLAQALRVHRRERVEALVTSGPPHTAHLIGWWLKRLTGVRWIADFRDPWTWNEGKVRSTRSVLSDRTEAWMERRVVEAADHVVLVTDRLREEFAHAYEHVPAAKFTTIWNGFDADDFDDHIGRPTGGPFTIAHVGSLYLRRSPAAFLTAVRDLIRQRRIPPEDLRILFAGEFADGCQVDGLVASLGLSRVAAVSEPVPHREAVGLMQRADLLLLSAQCPTYQVPAKTFEYLAAGPPILAIAEEGAAADLVRKTGGWVSADDPAMLAEVVHQAYLSHHSERESRPAQPWKRPGVQAYERRCLTGDLVELLGRPTS